MTLTSWASIVGFCARDRVFRPHAGTPRKRRRNSIDAPKASQALIQRHSGRLTTAATGIPGPADHPAGRPATRRRAQGLSESGPGGKPANCGRTGGFSGPNPALGASERKIYTTRGQKMVKPAPKTDHLPVHLRPIFSTPLEATGIPHVRLIPLPKYRHLRPR
jgi:hypothetical protein